MASPQQGAPAAPPESTAHSRLSRSSQRGWPLFLGITGMVAAVWGMINGAAELLLTAGMQAMSGKSAAFPGLNAAELLGKLRHFALINATGLFALGLLLLAGSFLLRRRRRIAGKMLTVWAVARIAFALATFPMLKDHFQLMGEAVAKTNAAQDSPAVPEPRPEAASTAVAGCLLPGFLLIWLHRPKIREEMARWTR